MRLYSNGTGVWRSLVARFVRDEEAVGSNPATPTGNRRDRLVPAIFYHSAFRGLATRFGVAPQISGYHEACLISNTCTPRLLAIRHVACAADWPWCDCGLRATRVGRADVDRLCASG